MVEDFAQARIGRGMVSPRVERGEFGGINKSSEDIYCHMDIRRREPCRAQIKCDSIVYVGMFHGKLLRWARLAGTALRSWWTLPAFGPGSVRISVPVSPGLLTTRGM